MTTISAHAITVNVGSQQNNITQYRPVTRLQQVSNPQPEINETDIIQISRPTTNVQTVTDTHNITQIAQQPEAINRTNVINLVQASSSSSSPSMSSSVNIYA